MSRFHAIAADGSRTSLELGAVLHKGGAEGSIHHVHGHSDQVVKLYHDVTVAQRLRPKIEAMLQRVPTLPPIKENRGSFVQIAWPSAIVTDAAGTMRGFQMPFIDLGRATLLEKLLQKAERRANGLPEDYHLRVFAALNLASIFAELHQLDHHMVDMKPVNLFVYRDAMFVAVVDCDGFSITDAHGHRFPASHYTLDYICPEAVNRKPTELGREQDCFALAVIVFQLLNNGIHPYQGIPRPGATVPSPLQDRVFANMYAYGRGGGGQQDPKPNSLHEYFEDSTRDLFDRTFSQRRWSRPQAAEWRDHLRHLIDSRTLVRCAAVPQEHAHFSKGCGFCARGRTAGPVPPQVGARPPPVAKPGTTAKVGGGGNGRTRQRRWRTLVIGIALLVVAIVAVVSYVPDLSARRGWNGLLAFLSANSAPPPSRTGFVGGRGMLDDDGKPPSAAGTQPGRNNMLGDDP